MSAIRDRLLDAELLEADLPEYRELLRSQFGNLPAEDQRRLIELIEHRPPPRTYASGEPLEEPDRGIAWLRAWQVRILDDIAEFLPEDVRARFPEVGRGGARIAREEDFEDLSGWVGDRAEIDADAILRTPIDELIRHLRTWTPPGRMDGPTMRGQGEALTTAITREPARFAEAALKFAGLDPTYVRSVFAGIEGAVKETRPFEWGSVLELAAWVLQQEAVDREDTFDRDPGWTWTRKAIADLLREALEPLFDLPIGLRDPVWAVLSSLADDPDPGGLVKADELRDALMSSINKVSGAAMHGVVQYVAWVMRSLVPEQQGRARELTPEAFSLLDAHVDPLRDRSVSTRGALGFRFAQLLWLDEHWTAEHIRDLFPEQVPTLAALTWQAYIVWNHASDRVIDRFPELYLAAARRAAEQAEDPGRVDPGERLADHLAVLYLRGKLGLDSAIFSEFYSHAAARLRGRLIEEVGRLLGVAPELSAEYCGRARALWEMRREQSRSAPPTERRDELEPFGYWLTAEKCDLEWVLAELVAVTKDVGSVEPDSRVLERLVQLAGEHPGESVRCVQNLIVAPKVRWFIDAHRGDILKIVATAASDPNAQPTATDVARRLLTAGFKEFEPLAR